MANEFGKKNRVKLPLVKIHKIIQLENVKTNQSQKWFGQLVDILLDIIDEKENQQKFKYFNCWTSRLKVHIQKISNSIQITMQKRVGYLLVKISTVYK